MNYTRTWFFGVLFAAATVFLLLTGLSLVEFVSTNEVSAKHHIQAIFLDECKRRGIDSTQYEGPYIEKNNFWQYEFYWHNKKAEKFAIGLTQYFPIQSEIWILEPGQKINISHDCSPAYSACKNSDHE